MNDFAQYVRTAVKTPKAPKPAAHGERAHSKYSASGAERWFNCSGSVSLSEGLPDKSSPWAIEGTIAHEVLEMILTAFILAGKWDESNYRRPEGVTPEMIRLAVMAARFIYNQHLRTPGSEIMVETKIYLDFIHPEMFGTFDGAVIDHFGILHVHDYKFGAGHSVSPMRNLQMIFYAIGLAYRFHWNFKRVRMWIIQPRIKGYDGPMFWEITIEELRKYVDQFQRAVDRVEQNPNSFTEGSWCHWCKAKSICPLKTEGKLEKAKSIFSVPVKQIDTEDFY
jgi:hypothetical protein